MSTIHLRPRCSYPNKLPKIPPSHNLPLPVRDFKISPLQLRNQALNPQQQLLRCILLRFASEMLTKSESGSQQLFVVFSLVGKRVRDLRRGRRCCEGGSTTALATTVAHWSLRRSCVQEAVGDALGGSGVSEMVIVVGCEQQLQTICGLQLSSCNFVSRRKRRRRRSDSSSAAVAMPLLFMPCRISATIACKLQVVSRVCNRSCSSILSVGNRRWRSRLVCMGAEKISHRQQQQHSQQQRRELSPVEQEEEEEEEEEVMEEDLMTQGDEFPSSSGAMEFSLSMASVVDSDATAMADRRRKERKRERTAYMFAAIASSIGFVTLAAGAVYYRFIWQMQGNGEVPYSEMLGTFSLAVGAAVGMEFWARWAHRALWHASLWNMHESHHKPREGPFELNDIFAIINAVPAISLMAIGFFNHGFVPGLCFGGGLGITMFGMAYMFVHDGLVHRRFPVGPVADVPYLQKVAAAHQLHHADLFGGIPYGLFLGPEELEEVGGQDELQKVLNLRYKVREGGREG